MVVVGMAASWWKDNRRIEETVKAAKAEHAAKQLELDDKVEIANKMNIEAQMRFNRVLGIEARKPSAWRRANGLP
jgi:hypothetical protein